MNRYFAIVVLTLGFPGTAAAQSRASLFIPADHWSNPFVEHLISNGTIRDPSPLSRPLKRRAVLAALRDVDRSNLSRATRETIGRIERDFTDSESDDVYRFTAFTGYRASNHARRYDLRREGPDTRSFLLGGSLTANLGSLVMSSNFFTNQTLNDDPDYTGKKNQPVSGRWVGYASFQSRHADIFLGKIERNWGPAFLPGLLVSNEPYSYDHLDVRLGTDVFYIETLYSPLNNVDDLSGVPNDRHFIAHRLVFTPRLPFVFSVGESILLLGPGRKLELWALNPLQVANFTSKDENSEQGINTQLSSDILGRVGEHATVFASFVLDDIQFKGGSTNDEPISYGLTLGANVGLRNGIGLTGFYTAVSNLIYRSSNRNPAENYARRGVGLGRNFSDYDQFTLRARFIPVRGVLLEPEITLLRQGEGDFRLPFPDPSEFSTTPVLHDGVVERTVRLALGGHVFREHNIQLSWNAGLHSTDNYRHVTGETNTDFVGTVTLRYRFSAEVPWH